MSLLKNKKGLIMGVAIRRSIGGISKNWRMSAVSFYLFSESLKKSASASKSLGSKLTIDCNVKTNNKLKTLF